MNGFLLRSSSLAIRPYTLVRTEWLMLDSDEIEMAGSTAAAQHATRRDNVRAGWLAAGRAAAAGHRL